MKPRDPRDLCWCPLDRRDHWIQAWFTKKLYGMKHLKQTFVCLRQGVHLIWISEAKHASCSQKTGWNSKNRRGLGGGGEGHHPCPSSDPCTAYLPIFFTFFPHCGPQTQTIKFSMPLIFFRRRAKQKRCLVPGLSRKVSKSRGLDGGTVRSNSFPILDKTGWTGPFRGAHKT